MKEVRKNHESFSFLMIVVIMGLIITAAIGCSSSNDNEDENPKPIISEINPLDKSLSDSGALTLSGVVKGELTQKTAELRFRLQGAEFTQSASDISLTINGSVVSPKSLSLTATEIVATVEFYDGRNDLSFKAYDTIGRPLFLTETVWSGSNTLSVNVLDPNGAPFLEPVTVDLTLSDDENIGASGNTSTGNLTFQNIPSRTVVVEARTYNNLVGVSGCVGSDGTITIRIVDFAPVSPVANNDFSLGLDGWNVGASPVTIIEHIEDFPAFSEKTSNNMIVKSNEESIYRSTREMRTASFADNDLQLATSGEGPQSLSRTFATSTGTTSVAVRYRFVTSEVPGGYFGSEYNDYFSVSLRSKAGGEIKSESNTMNGLGLGDFDFASGSTSWRNVTLKTDPKGDVIQLDVTVANVADALYDSYVVIDFIEERQDKVQPALSWNSVAGGLNLTYTVEGTTALEKAVTIEVYWASGSTYASQIGSPFFTYTVPAGTNVGQGGPISIPGTGLADDPSGTTHIIAATSETKIGVLPDVQISYGANANAASVSAGMIDVIKDGLRAAGQPTCTITSTARTPADQARAMFNNLVNSANPIATNVTNQLALYAAPGDAVINVFSSQTTGMTYSQIIAASATIQASMVTEINAQGPQNVSRHCADPAAASVIDIGVSSFNADNGQLFRASVTPRVTRFIDETTSNSCYHIELNL